MIKLVKFFNKRPLFNLHINYIIEQLNSVNKLLTILTFTPKMLYYIGRFTGETAQFVHSTINIKDKSNEYTRTVHVLGENKYLRVGKSLPAGIPKLRQRMDQICSGPRNTPTPEHELEVEVLRPDRTEKPACTSAIRPRHIQANPRPQELRRGLDALGSTRGSS